jgi:hypothetical protein
MSVFVEVHKLPFLIDVNPSLRWSQFSRVNNSCLCLKLSWKGIIGTNIVLLEKNHRNRQGMSHFLGSPYLHEIFCQIRKCLLRLSLYLNLQVRTKLFGPCEATYSGYTCYTGIADFIPADIDTVGYVCPG